MKHDLRKLQHIKLKDSCDMNDLHLLQYKLLHLLQAKWLMSHALKHKPAFPMQAIWHEVAMAGLRRQEQSIYSQMKRNRAGWQNAIPCTSSRRRGACRASMNLRKWQCFFPFAWHNCEALLSNVSLP